MQRWKFSRSRWLLANPRAPVTTERSSSSPSAGTSTASISAISFSIRCCHSPYSRSLAPRNLGAQFRDPLLPLAVQPIPVPVVVAGPLLEVHQRALDLRGVGHRV